MMNSQTVLQSLSNSELLARTRELVEDSRRIEADLLVHLGDRALDLLIQQVNKERFATGRKPRPASTEPADEHPSRHIPDGIKRTVYERDGGRCTFTGADPSQAAVSDRQASPIRDCARRWPEAPGPGRSRAPSPG